MSGSDLYKSLTPTLNAWMQALRAWLADMRTDSPFAFDDPAQPTSIEIADRLVSWWNRNTDSEFAKRKHVVELAAVACGDALAAEFQIEWIVDPDSPSSVVLVSDPLPDGDRAIISPISMFEKHVGKDIEEGLVADLYNSVRDFLIEQQLPRRGPNG